MTVQTTSSKAGPLPGNGLTTVFQTPFRVDQAADLQVIYTDDIGVDTQLAASAYSVTGFADPNGVSVTYPIGGTPISAAENITLLRIVSYDQQTSITNQGGFYPQVIERALDRIVYQTQQLAEKLGRAITLSASSALSGLFLPDPEAGKYLRGRLDGDGYENAELTSSGTIGLPLLVSQGGTQADNPGDARTNLGLGSAATYDVADVPGKGMKNRIINGGMDIAQRGTSFAGFTVGTAYTLDRWAYSSSSAAIATISQQVDAPPANEFQNSLRVTVTTADASLSATDQTNIRQAIEGYNIRDLIGRDTALSFWVRSAKAGTHCVSFRNSGNDRSYIAEYTVNVANTWERKTIALPGGLITAGTWNFTNGIGLIVAWALAAGTNYQITANAWQTGNFLATANQVNCLDTAGNIFALVGVQLEIGSTATNFEHRLFGSEVALCQRYFEKSFPLAVTPIGGTGGAGALSWSQNVGASTADNGSSWPFKVTKCGFPTMGIYNPAVAGNFQARNLSANANCSSSSLQFASEAGFSVTVITAAGSAAGQLNGVHWTADAEL